MPRIKAYKDGAVVKSDWVPDPYHLAAEHFAQAWLHDGADYVSCPLTRVEDGCTERRWTPTDTFICAPSPDLGLPCLYCGGRLHRCSCEQQAQQEAKR